MSPADTKRGKKMDYKKNKSKIWNRFLVQILTVMMVFSMMPSQTFAYYAAADETGKVAEEQVAPAGDQTDNKDQGGGDDQSGTQDNQEDPDTPAVQPDAPDNNTDSGVPAADQKQEDKDQQKDNADGTKPAASDAKKGTEGSSVVKNGTGVPETPAEVKADGKKAGTKAGGATPAQKAEEYYGEGGRAKTFEIELSRDKATAKAGDEVTYNIDVTTWAAATYPYDGQNTEPMFKDWEDITITLKLPKHMSITGFDKNKIASCTQIDVDNNIWQINLISDTKDAVEGDEMHFSITAQIEGNGVLPDGLVLGEKEGDVAEVTMSANFDVRISEDGDTMQYSHTATANTGSVKLETPDKWVMTKNPYAGSATHPYTIDTSDEEHKKVIIHYLIKYGLNANGVPDPNDGAYTKTGRVPFDHDITLTDIPKLKLPKIKSSDPDRYLEAQSVTVTPANTGYVYLDSSLGPADEGDKAKPIVLTKTGTGWAKTYLPHAVIGPDYTDKVAATAPAYSEYYVDMVYDYDEFMVMYYENPEDPDSIKSHSENEGIIEYQLLGQKELNEIKATGKTDVDAYVKPGFIEIQKMIYDYSGQNPALYTKTDSLVSGPAVYEVRKNDNTKPTLYYIDANGDYQPITGNTLTIDPDRDPSTTNGNNGKIGFYLDAGTYKIEETDRPEHTKIKVEDSNPLTSQVAEGKSVKAVFNNQEELGEILIYKGDDSAAHLPLKDAVFGIYYDEAHRQPVKENGVAVTAKTGNSGYAKFERLVPGTYYIYEEEAPKGYIKSEDVKEVVVEANVIPSEEEAISFTNTYNQKVIYLHKKYCSLANPDPETAPFVTDDFRKFDDAFVLQVSTDGVNWKDFSDVEAEKYTSIDNKGKSSKVVDVLDENGKAYKYRFVETVPEGYFDAAGNAGGDEDHPVKVISEVITPADGKDTITMINYTGGYIELAKNKVSVNNSPGGYDCIPQSGKTFALYRVAEGEENKNAEFITEKTTAGAGGVCTFSDLAFTKGGKPFTYYVVEKNTDAGYIWDANDSILVNGTRTRALKIGSFVESNSATLSKVTYNLPQNVEIYITKIDKFSETKLPGVVFTISDVTPGGQGGKQDITLDNGEKTLPIELNKKYTITEKSVPAGYYLDTTPQPIDTIGWTVHKNDKGNFAVFDSDNNEVTAETLTFIFADIPYKKVLVNKKLKNLKSGATTDFTNVTFTVYIKNGDNFEPYKVDGKTVTIKGDGTAISLPNGPDATHNYQYYLHEETTETTRKTSIDPDQHRELYEDADGDGQPDGEFKDGQFYFGPYEVTRPTGKDDKLRVPIINISNTGDLIVNKDLFDYKNIKINPLTEPDKLSGFNMDVYKVKADGSLEKVRSLKTAPGGKATFGGLQVYDDQGNSIEYVVKESYLEGQDEYYYTYNDTASNCRDNPVTLTLGGTVDAGVVENHEYLKATVLKMYYDAREYQLTDLKYELEGAVIVLYKNVGNGHYEKVDQKTTNYRGLVTFGQLEYSANGYVAIEYSVPDDPEYKYMKPVNGKYLKDYVGGGDPPATLGQSDVDQLSKAVLEANTEKPGELKGEIDNVIPWTQIHINKIDEDNTDLFLDGADFTLYKQVLPETTPTNRPLTFSESAEGLTVVGQYTSGTWIQNDEPVKGQFQTDILENDDHIVYWLVETKAPPGYTWIDSERIVLFTSENTTYMNDSAGGSKNVVRLKDNTINYHTVKNQKVTGPDGTDNRAFIEFNKWMQKNDEDTAKKKKEELKRSDFTLMPNATFELYAVNASTGNKVYLLDTITTGDENTVKQGAGTTGYGVSRALDAWEIFDYIEKKLPDQLDDIITFESTASPEHPEVVTYPYDKDGKRIPGTFWLNAVLVETSSSSKYELDTHDHNLRIEFKTVSEGGLNLGNAKYAIPVLEESDAPFCDSEEGKEKIKEFDKENADHTVAIVDYLAVDNSVVLQHFGYDPEDVGYMKTNAGLNAKREENPAWFLSKKVTFALERKDAQGKWVPWDSENNEELGSGQGTFETDGNGYHFKKGLLPGEYRAYMTVPVEGGGYENFYPKPAGKTDVAFHFTVVTSDRTQTFTTYSPSRLDVTIKKTDLERHVISDKATFRLAKKSGTGAAYNKTADTVNGTAEFKDLPASDTFTLTEEKAPEGYTNAYFAKLFTAKNSAYKNLVNGTGYPLSYQTKDENGERLIVDNNYRNAFTLEAPNIKTVSLELTKKESQAPYAVVPGAEFTVYYQAFDKVEGQYTVPAYSGDGWTKIDTLTTTTDSEGKIKWSGLAPGVYYVVETKAPSGYDPDPNGKIIVMKGGLPLIIAEGNYQIAELQGSLEFADKPQVNMIIRKDVDAGEVPKKDYNFTFKLAELVDGKLKPITSTKNKASGKIEEDGTTTYTDAVFANLSQGKTYYLQEVDQVGYERMEVKYRRGKDGSYETIAAETQGAAAGWYPIEIEDNDRRSVEVVVTNKLLEARVTFFKYDGVDGTGLSGAKFVVQDAERNTVAQATELEPKEGKYLAIIPLKDSNKTKFYIHETKAPDPDPAHGNKRYTIDDGNADIVVEVEPGYNLEFEFYGVGSKDNKYTLPNYEGIPVKIVKYGGLPEGSHKLFPGAKFQMYFRKGNGSWNPWHGEETTGENGEAEFLILNLDGYEYAIAETNENNLPELAGVYYKGLYGVYDGSTLLNTTTADRRTLYILDKDFVAGQEYSFNAYNIPFLKLIVNKEDISTKVDIPNAHFNIYEVDDSKMTAEELEVLIKTADENKLTEAQINDLTQNAKDIREGTTNKSTYTNNNFIQPGKTYFVIEDHAFDGSGTVSPYSIIKDDSRVVRYRLFSVPEKNYEEQYEVTLKNNLGDADVKLVKGVVPDKLEQEGIDSLTAGNADLVYTLKPTTNNGYALDPDPEDPHGFAYRLKDSGLTATLKNPDSASTLAKEWYNIKQVTLGQAEMSTFLKGAKNNTKYDIYAIVTFVDFAGNKYVQPRKNVSQGTANVVSNGTGKNIKSFYVDYISPDLESDTGYALGQNFSAGESSVDVTVFKQEKQGTDPINQITEIRNDADVQLFYYPWDSDGNKGGIDHREDSDDITIPVKSVKAPLIKFTKSSSDYEMDAPVELGNDINYKLRVENVSKEPANLTDPIIVDLLPQGMTIDHSTQYVKVTHKPDSIDNKYTVSTGYAGDSEYVVISFNGTVPYDADNPENNYIEVELTANVTDAVTSYGSTIKNYAFTTSKEVGVATIDNQTGAVIRDADDNGAWARELVDVATDLGCDNARAEALKEKLGADPGQPGSYGYLGAWYQNIWASESQLACIKKEYGPGDGEVYRTDKVAVLVNDEEHDDQRTMHYQLTINNLSASKRTNLVVMDIMPAVDDNRINATERGSQWPLYFDNIKSVKVNGKECTGNYEIYYYSDKADFDEQNDEISNIIDEFKDGSCPTGWSKDKPAHPTAIVLVFAYDPDSLDDSVILNGNASVQVEYTAKIDHLKPAELNKIVFTNAANDFNFGYSTITGADIKPNKSIGSNVVEVTIAPTKVMVGGDVWIDANSDGWQNDGDQRWYLKYDIVKQLINQDPDKKELSVALNISDQKNFDPTGQEQGTIKETGSYSLDSDKYGIAHFEFNDLMAAKLRGGSTDPDDLKNWINDKAGNEAGKLVGKNPYTYNMDLSYRGSIFTKTTNNVKPRGSYVPKAIPDDDRIDDNFEAFTSNSKAASSDYRTEQFFLHQTTDDFDMTKDVGFNVPRKLELTKVSQSDGKPLEGAEFTIYGPFDHDTGADQTLSEANKFGVFTTDASGKFEIPTNAKKHLFFFKKYVIVETTPAPEHSIEGAKVEAGANIRKLGEGKWLLEVPPTDTTFDDEYVDDVTISDPGNIDVEVEKIWDGDEDAYGTRPKSILATLYTDRSCEEEYRAKDATGNPVDSITLDASNEWKGKWTGLPKYKAVNGQEPEEIEYFVKETDSDGNEFSGYSVSIKSEIMDNGNQKLTITNTPITTGLDVRKEWKDTDEIALKVTAVTFRVEQSTDGETWSAVKKNGKDINLTINRKSGETMGTAKVDDLPAYDADNNPLTYRAVETSITVNGKNLEVKDGKVGPYEVSEVHTPGKDASPEKATARDLSEITNTMVPTQFSVEKSFVEDEFNLNKEIKAVTVQLQRKTDGGKWTDVDGGSYDLTRIRGWKHTWKKLPKFDWEGNAFEYRAIEVSYTTKSGETVNVNYDSSDKTSGTVGAYNYTSSTEGTVEDGFTTYIENTPPTGGLEVTKNWKNSKNKKLPESLKVTLKAYVHGKEVSLSGVKKSVTLSKENNWADSTTWAELPVYYTDGSKISYRLTESGKGRYDAEYSVYYDGEIISEGDGESLDVTIYANDTVKAKFTNTLEGHTRTGDEAPLTLYLTLLIVSAGVLLALFIRKRRSM